MVLKRRTPPPLALQELDALIPRLPSNYPRLDEMKQDAAKRYKGFIGEKRIDYYLEKLPHHFSILQDISLEIKGDTFQVDSLILSDHAIYPIEIKNFNGKMTFNTIFDQFTRTIDGTETGYRNPITQVKKSKQLLNRWLHSRGIENVPIYPFVAISEPSTIIDVIGDASIVAHIVGHGEHIPDKVTRLNEDLRRRFARKLDRIKLARRISAEHKELDIDILGKYGVRRENIKPGVQCPKCKWISMVRIYGEWRCTRCNHRSKDAHKKAMDDYFLLIKPWMTNTECMRFLKLESRGVATRILQTSGLVYQKEKRRWISRN